VVLVARSDTVVDRRWRSREQAITTSAIWVRSSWPILSFVREAMEASRQSSEEILPARGVSSLRFRPDLLIESEAVASIRQNAAGRKPRAA